MTVKDLLKNRFEVSMQLPTYICYMYYAHNYSYYLYSFKDFSNNYHTWNSELLSYGKVIVTKKILRT